MTMRTTTPPRPFLVGDEETIAIGLKYANEIARIVYAPITDTTITIPANAGIRVAPRLTSAQRRLLDTIRAQGGAKAGAEYWPAVNDWVKDTGRIKALALHNINTTVEALLKAGIVTLDEDGVFHLTDPKETH